MVPGLTFRVGKTGSSWSILTYDHKSVRKRITLGSYPEVGLAQARSLATGKRDVLQAATDESRRPFCELVDAYGEQEGHRLRSWKDQKSTINCVFAAILEKPCGDLTERAIQHFVDVYPARVMALKAVGYISPVIKWGRRRGWTTMSVSEVERPKGVSKPRERTLAVEEQSKIVNALYGATQPHYRVMWLLLLTSCRLHEIADLRWDEIEFGPSPIIRIPKERYKTNIETSVPLVPQAEALLWEIMGERIEGDLVFGTLNNWARWGERLKKETGTSGWTRHDLRRTTATVAGESGVAPYIIDAMLGHKSIGGSAIHAVYNKSRYITEVREALKSVANYYISLTE